MGHAACSRRSSLVLPDTRKIGSSGLCRLLTVFEAEVRNDLAQQPSGLQPCQDLKLHALEQAGCQPVHGTIRRLTGLMTPMQESFVGEWNLQSSATLLAGLAPAAAPSSAVTSSRGRHLLYSFSDFLAAITNPQGTYQNIAAASYQVCTGL